MKLIDNIRNKLKPYSMSGELLVYTIGVALISFGLGMVITVWMMG